MKLDKHLQEHLHFCYQMFDLVKDYLITTNRRETTVLIAHQDANTSHESPRLVCPLYPLKYLITLVHILASLIYPSTNGLGFDILKQDSIQFPELSDDLAWTHLWTKHFVALSIWVQSNGIIQLVSMAFLYDLSWGRPAGPRFWHISGDKLLSQICWRNLCVDLLLVRFGWSWYWYWCSRSWRRWRKWCGKFIVIFHLERWWRGVLCLSWCVHHVENCGPITNCACIEQVIVQVTFTWNPLQMFMSSYTGIPERQH